MSEKILVTGGAGYIGSHTCLALLQAGFDVVVLDNLCNGSETALERVSALSGRTLKFVKGDIGDTPLVCRLLTEHCITGVIHFAGLKAVGESVVKPLDYYDTNVSGTLSLCRAMQEVNVKRLVFSSSATVYGEEAPVPYHEALGRGKTTQPYGTSKAMVEQILEDLYRSDPEWGIAVLRYFNPVGAHSSGLIGEDPKGIPNNLMPYMAQVAAGKREYLSVFGNDYPTPDGTCRRDYLHVVDLADGHLKALDWLQQPGVDVFNLGTGQAYSVLDMLRAFEGAIAGSLPYRIAPRRPGDLPEFWADASKAENVLGWKATLGLNQMMEDTWRWQSQNPNGYA
ncbi:UDP-glucose 4-epimerase GalE [Oceanospirillum linum]|uniref:UDP-glucose 4-epimerase n=1 Tax=Oceanospirillum linum TaxID=966 RepID=A0A1T1H7S1_OCELI|nr:UDP-glucose 4-epimerase GalE [Oceanospirillum linum]OOV85911.1 UDP-glucose 4-epimerase GalE [Oceanospirillum linum]SEG51517.1 UDP-galactose 4-epimerase [Oleiphilus messinensis]SMP35572.1 UDP-galactose 4-epimerase [Oceanospirillum linum]